MRFGFVFAMRLHFLSCGKCVFFCQRLRLFMLIHGAVSLETGHKFEVKFAPNRGGGFFPLLNARLQMCVSFFFTPCKHQIKS